MAGGSIKRCDVIVWFVMRGFIQSGAVACITSTSNSSSIIVSSSSIRSSISRNTTTVHQQAAEREGLQKQIRENVTEKVFQFVVIRTMSCEMNKDILNTRVLPWRETYGFSSINKN